MPRLLALDPATVTGWAYSPSGRLRDAETGIWRAKGTENEPHALASLQSEALRAFLEENDVDYALIEKPVSAVLKSIGAQNALWCLGGGLASVLSHHGIPYRTVQPSVWRAAVYGVGGGKMTSGVAKQMALKVARNEGIDVKDHNAAEALAQLVYLIGHHQLWQLEDGQSELKSRSRDRPRVSFR